MTIRVDLNLAEKRRNLFDPLGLVLMLAVAASGSAFYAYGQFLEQQIQRIDQKTDVLDGKIKQGESVLAAIEKERRQLAELEGQLKLAQSLRLDGLKYANLLAEVSRSLPESVYIDSLVLEAGSNRLSCSGTAGGPRPLSSIAGAMERLNRSDYFDSAALQNASRTGKDYRFSLSANFHPLAGGL